MSIFSLSILPNELSMAKRAANSPARFPNTRRSDNELPPSRFAPLMPAAHSPAANSPGPPRVFVSLAITPALLFAVRGLRSIILRNFVEHESPAFLVCQNSSFAAHAFSHENSADAWGPDHSSRMKLDELHVDQFRACFVG